MSPLFCWTSKDVWGLDQVPLEVTVTSFSKPQVKQLKGHVITNPRIYLKNHIGFCFLSLLIGVTKIVKKIREKQTNIHTVCMDCICIVQ